LVENDAVLQSLAVITLVLLVPFIGVEVLQRTSRARLLLAKDGSWGAQAIDWGTYTLLVFAVVYGTWIDRRQLPPWLHGLTTLLMCLHAAGFLRALRSFGFLVFMMRRIVLVVRPFVAMMLIVVVTSGFCFSALLLSDLDSNRPFGDAVGLQIWQMFLLTFLGDFDSGMFFAGENTWAVACLFVAIVFFVNIIMLNVLIAIVSDGYAEVNSRQREETVQQLARIVVELEATYLVHWYSSYTVIRGQKFLEIEYPTWLLDLAQIRKHDRPNDPLTLM